jgi:hypothetical protein
VVKCTGHRSLNILASKSSVIDHFQINYILIHNLKMKGTHILALLAKILFLTLSQNPLMLLFIIS